MKSPKPAASSLRRKSGCVIRWSRSTSDTIAPAMNAPRIASSPSDSATAAKPISSTNAARTRICAVVSCRRIRSARIRIECSAPRTSRKTAADSANSSPSSSSVDPDPPSPEKKIESRMIAPKSAIEPAATINWPNVVAISPASLSTGISTPSDVAHRMIVTRTGVSTSPAPFSPSATASAIASDSTKPTVASLSSGPRRRVELDLQAGQEQHEREPERRDHRDRRVDLDDAQQRRAEHDPGDDFQHDRREPHAREQAEHERGDEGHGRDDHEVAEGGHAGESARRRFRYGRFGARCWLQPPSQNFSRACAQAMSGRSRRSSPATTIRCSPSRACM